MDDGRTVGDRSKKNSRASVHTTNTSGRAMKVDESSGRWKSKVGTREGDGNERKVASTVGPNRANNRWTAERRSNINEKNRINGRAMNIEKSDGRRKNENGSREGHGDKGKTAGKVGPNKAKKQWNGKEKGDGGQQKGGLI